jgi:hypothetical protein
LLIPAAGFQQHGQRHLRVLDIDRCGRLLDPAVVDHEVLPAKAGDQISTRIVHRHVDRDRPRLAIE